MLQRDSYRTKQFSKESPKEFNIFVEKQSLLLL